MFAAMVERDAGGEIALTNRMSLIVAANDYRSIRGRTLVSVVMDEVAFWRGEGSQRPDLEVYRAVLPGLASMPGAMLIGISSPYRRAGLLWQKFKRHWGKPGSVLVIKATTEQLNPLIDRQIIAAALEDDPAAARAEWLSEFRADIADYVSREIIESLVSPGVHERAPRRGCGISRSRTQLAAVVATATRSRLRCGLGSVLSWLRCGSVGRRSVRRL